MVSSQISRLHACTFTKRHITWALNCSPSLERPSRLSPFLHRLWLKCMSIPSLQHSGEMRKPTKTRYGNGNFPTAEDGSRRLWSNPRNSMSMCSPRNGSLFHATLNPQETLPTNCDRLNHYSNLSILNRNRFTKLGRRFRIMVCTFLPTPPPPR